MSGSAATLEQALATCRSDHWSMRELMRARRVLVGLDDGGRQTHPTMYDSNVISFAHGEGIRRPHETVVAAGVRAIRDAKTISLENYLFLSRHDLLEDAIREYFHVHGVTAYPSDAICIDAGTTRAVLDGLAALCNSGDVVITAPGYYHALAAWCDILGLDLMCVRPDMTSGAKITADNLNSTIDEIRRHNKRSRIVMMLFNPTYLGAIYTLSELQQLAEACEAADVFCIEDAIFADTEFNDLATTPHLRSANGTESRVLTVMGVSKAFGLANLRIGWAIGPGAVVEKMRYLATTNIPAIPFVAKEMALAALRAPRRYLAENSEECRKRAALVEGAVDTLNRSLAEFQVGAMPVQIVFPPRSGHSLLASFDGLAEVLNSRGIQVRDIVDLTAWLLREARVAVSPGNSMGFGKFEARLTFGCLGYEHTHEASLRREAHLMDSIAYDDLASIGFETGRNKIAAAISGRISEAVASVIG